jgi:hypothetical protein
MESVVKNPDEKKFLTVGSPLIGEKGIVEVTDDLDCFSSYVIKSAITGGGGMVLARSGAHRRREDPGSQRAIPGCLAVV